MPQLLPHTLDPSLGLHVHPLPSSLQAFPPATKVPTLYNNNFYGAGSGALRVYTQTLNTFGADVNEVQQIVTRATTGQTIAGGFRLVMRGNRTALIKCGRASVCIWDLRCVGGNVSPELCSNLRLPPIPAPTLSNILPPDLTLSQRR
jgi:hypothetical protein